MNPADLFVRCDCFSTAPGYFVRLVKFGLLGHWFDWNPDDALEIGRQLVAAGERCSGKAKMECPECKGKGRVVYDEGYPTTNSWNRQCMTCRGAGEVGDGGPSAGGATGATKDEP